MKMDPMKFSYRCGLLGSTIIVLGSLITALSYQGKEGESYSLLNHFISELGEVGVSKFAPVFNFSLIIGGVVLVIYVIGLGLYIHTKRGYVAALFGTFFCISCSLVGPFH
jgi:hypothetical membrane protein